MGYFGYVRATGFSMTMQKTMHVLTVSATMYLLASDATCGVVGGSRCGALGGTLPLLPSRNAQQTLPVWSYILVVRTAPWQNWGKLRCVCFVPIEILIFSRIR